MNKIYFLCILFISPKFAKSQAISVLFGTAFTKSKPESRIIAAKSDFSNATYPIGIDLNYSIPKSKISISTSFQKYSGFTYIRFSNGGYLDPFGSPVISTGFNGINVKRIDFALHYQLTKKTSFFIIRPGIGLGTQFARKNGFALLNAPINGPDYIQTEPMSAEVFNNNQIVPLASLEITFRLFKRIEIGILNQGVLGYKPYQRLTLKYTYKGQPQADAIYVSDGTGIFSMLRIGYRFAKLVR